ncbi:uncharacterized protein [Oscarella lobularis]|uniref:uncharacterized protein n=1 Tax=Oscarella lobularis TaxID=121494 RepID=UPI0033136B2E
MSSKRMEAGDDDDDLDDFVLPKKRKRVSENVPAPGPTLSRFAEPVTDEQVREAEKGYVPPNTSKANTWAKRLFANWMEERNALLIEKDRKSSDIGPFNVLGDGSDEELSKWISRFLLEVRIVKGEEYPPSTLNCLLCVAKSRPRDPPDS